jgi:multiple sugar transport system ATP-binding protein
VAAITLEQVDKVYRNGHAALHAIDLSVGDGELLVLVGPSGCGKSTVLRVMAGLEMPTRGRVLLDDRDVTADPPQARDLAMVFQSYALYPHMTVRENLAYGLRVRGTARAAIDARVTEVAEALALETVLGRRPAQLSGGQRQRVALGRAMVRAPRAFLFDEPLSNLDPTLRAQARAELLRLHRRLGATMVYVTHDQEEAMTLGSRVAVMFAGRIEQVAAPLDVYARPANLTVARFIGAPAMNILDGPLPGIAVPDGVRLGIRPQDVVLGDDGPIRATVDVLEPRGHDTVVSLTLDTPHAPVITAVTTAVPPAEGSGVTVRFPPERVHLFDAASGLRLDRSVA